jgi:hypothetical protein
MKDLTNDRVLAGAYSAKKIAVNKDEGTEMIIAKPVTHKVPIING